VRCVAHRRVRDLQLAAGTAPRSSAALPLRTVQLCRTRTRRAIARRPRRTIQAAWSAPDDRWGCASLGRSEVLAEADALLDPVRRLEAERPLEPMGVALARVLARDPNSPLAVGAEPRTLRAVGRLATAALDVAPASTGQAGDL
jgi:hypothetical protein